jgi:zinc protease
VTNALIPLEKPPSPGAPHRAELPMPVERTFPNGLRAIVFQQRSGPKAFGVPIVAAQLMFRGGASAEDEAEAGLAQLTASLLTQGTAQRSAVELAQAVDGLGARLDASSGYDATVVSVSALTNVFPTALALLDEVVRTPVFAAHEVERVRTKAIGDLALTYSNPSALARLIAQRVAFGTAPYGHPIAGTAETLGSLERAHVAAFHERYVRPDNATLILGGDIAPDAAFALIEREFGDWRAPSVPLSAAPRSAPPAPRARVVIFDKPDAGRTAIAVGRIGIARRAPEYVSGVVATAVLSGYSGRLNQEVRVKRGLSYGAGAQLMARRAPGMVLASTLVDHTRVAEATEVILATLGGLAAEAPAETELVTRKATVTGSFSRSIETIDGIAGVLGELALYDLPLGELGAYLPHVEAVTPDDVRDFVATFVARDPFVVLVGDAQRFSEAIGATYGEVSTIPAGQLDLTRATLVR